MSDRPSQAEHSRRHHAVHLAFELVVVVSAIGLGSYAVGRFNPHPFTAAIYAIPVWEAFLRSHFQKYLEHGIGVLKPAFARGFRDNA